MRQLIEVVDMLNTINLRYAEEVNTHIDFKNDKTGEDYVYISVKVIKNNKVKYKKETYRVLEIYNEIIEKFDKVLTEEKYEI